MAKAPRPPDVRRSTVRRWLLVVGAVSVAILVWVAYLAFIWPALYGSGTPVGLPPGTAIDLIPSTGTPSACITGTPGVPRPTLALSEGVLQANTYNVPTGTTGHVGMCYDAASQSMFAYANWSKVGPAGGWFSYPQITYGVNDWAGRYTTFTNQSPLWELPQTVASAEDENVWFTTSYEFHAPSASDVTGYDLSFDEFLTETLPPEFEVGPFVEVELFLAHNISYPFQWIHWEMPTLVNSILEVEPWDVAYWCHGVDNGSNANISFDFSYGGQSTPGLATGELGVNMSAVMAEVESLMPGNTCWTGPDHGFGGFYWDEANLGSEDGAVGGSVFNYNWTVEEYCLHALPGPARTSNLACT